MSKFIKFTAVTLAFGVILSSFLAFNFLNQNIKAQAAQLNTSDFTLPAGYSICAVQDNNQLNTAIKVTSGMALNPTITGTKYNLYAVNSTLCNLATTQNSSSPFTFYSYSNHNTNLKINSLTPGNPPTLNVSVEYPNLPPIYSAPNNNNSKTFNLCVGSTPSPVPFSIIDGDKDALIKNTPTTFNATPERSVSVTQGAGFVNYTVTPTQEFLNTPNDFTITTTAKEEDIGNLNQIPGFGTLTATQSITVISRVCTSSSSSSLAISSSSKPLSSNSSLILSSSTSNTSSGILSSSVLSSSALSLVSSSKISSSSQIPSSISSILNLISSSSSNNPTSSSNNSSLIQSSSVKSSSLVLNSSPSSSSLAISSLSSSSSSCTLPTPPNVNTCQTNSSNQSSIKSSSIPTISSSKVSSSSQMMSSISSSPSLVSSSRVSSISNSNTSLSKSSLSILISSSQVSSTLSTPNSNLSSSSSTSSCVLPTPPNANTCLINSLKSSSSLSSEGALITSNSSTSNTAQSSSPQPNSISSQSSLTSDSSQSSNINSSSSQNNCGSSQSNQSLADSELESDIPPEYTDNECEEPEISTGGTTVANNGGGVITISNFTSTDSAESSNFSIDDPYICGEALQGQVYSDSLNNLDKVYLDLESTIDPNLFYTILPYVNSDGTYQFETINIEPSSYKITYYGINKDGTQTESQSYIADIKPEEDCVPLQNLSEDNRQRGVLDYAYTPIVEENINVETLTKIAQANQPQLAQKSNSETQGLVRTGGEKPQSIAAIILVLIVIIWLLQTNPIKKILVNKTNQNLRLLISLSILTTSVSMSEIYLGGNILIQTQDQNKFFLNKPVFALCLHSSSNKNIAFQNLTLPYI
jgi:hypothetical protein